MKTWHIECSFVAVVLFLVAWFSGFTISDQLVAGAVLLTFCHHTVADRLQEQESLRVKKSGHASVSCYRWLYFYFVSKEIVWVCAFLALKSYPAIVGVIVFLHYPIWRKIWRKYHPLVPDEKEKFFNPELHTKIMGYVEGKRTWIGSIEKNSGRYCLPGEEFKFDICDGAFALNSKGMEMSKQKDSMEATQITELPGTIKFMFEMAAEALAEGRLKAFVDLVKELNEEGWIVDKVDNQLIIAKSKK